MYQINDIDFRDLRPSMAKWLGQVLDDETAHKAVVEKLRSYLQKLDTEQAASYDQAIALSHELSSLGFWDKIDEDLLTSYLSSDAPDKIRIMLSAAPVELEERILEAKEKASAQAKRRSLVKRSHERKSGLKARSKRIRTFFVAFESQRVAETLRLPPGVLLSSKEKLRLCKMLDSKSSMYVKGMPWRASVTEVGGKDIFVLRQLAPAPAMHIAAEHLSGIGKTMAKVSASGSKPAFSIWHPEETSGVLWPEGKSRKTSGN